MASFALLGADRQTLNVPTTRPRLWWTPERLAQARAWYAAHRFTPIDDDYVGQAYRYLMTGEVSYARSAINYALGRTISERSWPGWRATRRAGSARVILIFDWCYDQMTQAERETLISRWNGYLDTLRQKCWGGPDFPQNNYYWGYLRNELSWAITTYYENPMAETFLESALKMRWQDSFLPHASTTGRGGVPQEGSQYGRYLLRYPVVPFTTAALAGRDLFDETDFFKAALFYVIYSTTPAPTALRSASASYYEVFPSNDDEMFRRGRSAQNIDYGDFMSAVAQHWRNIPVGGYARQWLRMTGTAPSSFIAAVDPGGAARDFRACRWTTTPRARSGSGRATSGAQRRPFCTCNWARCRVSGTSTTTTGTGRCGATAAGCRARRRRIRRIHGLRGQRDGAGQLGPDSQQPAHQRRRVHRGLANSHASRRAPAGEPAGVRLCGSGPVARLREQPGRRAC